MSSYPRRHLKLLRTASTWVTFSSPLEWAMVIFLLMLAVLGTLTAPRMWNGGQLMEQDEPSPPGHGAGHCGADMCGSGPCCRLSCG